MEARKKQNRAGELVFGNVVSKIIVAEKVASIHYPLSIKFFLNSKESAIKLVDSFCFLLYNISVK